MDKEDNIRAFVDLDVQGNAKGGCYVRNDLKEIIERIEKKGIDKVVGVVYDGTYDLEILTKPVEDFKKLDVMEKVKQNGKVS